MCHLSLPLKRMYEIDAKHPETLVNVHVEVPEWFQRELLRIGGKTLNGLPLLRCVWGQSETTFVCEQWIPKYRSGLIKETTEKMYRLRDIHTQEVKPCTFEEAKDAWEGNLDGKYTSEVYEHLVLEPIGLPRFVVEQFVPVREIKDTPDGWESNRYKMFSVHPSIPEKRTDMIGPFPFGGRYEGFHIVKIDDGTRYGKFRPVGRDAVEEVERAWARRNVWKQTKSDELMAKDLFQAAAEKERRDEAETVRRLNDALLPQKWKGRTIRRA